MRPLPPIWEAAGWGGLFLLALGLRLGGLEGYPLAPKEAETAYAAWRLVQGAPLATTPLPLPLSVTTASFFLFGASDLAARLGSVLAGSMVVPAMALFRRELGSWGALGAAALAAASPTLIHSSRFLSSAPFALLLMMVGASLLLRWGRGEGGAFWGLAALAGLLLNGGALGLGFVLVAILFGALHQALGPGFPRPPVRDWVGAGMVFLATFYLIGTAFTVNWSGLGMKGMEEWNDAFAGDGLGGGGDLLLWASYEPLLVGLSLGGLGRSLMEWRRGGVLDLTGMNGLLAWWGGVALILMMVGGVAVFAPFLTLSLVLGGGPLLVSWVARLGALRWESSWGYYLTALVGVVLSLLLVNWLTLPDTTAPTYYWLLVLVGLAPALLLVILVYRGRLSSSPAWALGLVGLLALTIHSESALGYGAPAAEPLVAQASPLDIRDALEGVTRRAGNPYWWTGAEIQLDQRVAQPWLWYLREYPHVMLVEEAQGNPAVAIVAADGGGALAGYQRGRGPLWVQARGPEGGASAWWRWFVFRQPRGEPSARHFEIFFRE